METGHSGRGLQSSVNIREGRLQHLPTGHAAIDLSSRSYGHCRLTASTSMPSTLLERGQNNDRIRQKLHIAKLQINGQFLSRATLFIPHSSVNPEIELAKAVSCPGKWGIPVNAASTGQAGRRESHQGEAILRASFAPILAPMEPAQAPRSVPCYVSNAGGN